MSETIDWEKEDEKYIWHPAQQMKDAEVFPPVVIDHAKGLYLYDTEEALSGYHQLLVVQPAGTLQSGDQ